MKKGIVTVILFTAIGLFTPSSPVFASEDMGQCMGECASEQGQCIGQCMGDNQCISHCHSAHSRCISRCNR